MEGFAGIRADYKSQALTSKHFSCKHYQIFLITTYLVCWEGLVRAALWWQQLLINCTSVRRFSVKWLTVCVCVCGHLVYFWSYHWAPVQQQQKFPHIWWQRWDCQSISKLTKRHPSTKAKDRLQTFLCLNSLIIFIYFSNLLCVFYCLCLCTLLQDLVFCSSAVH